MMIVMVCLGLFLLEGGTMGNNEATPRSESVAKKKVLLLGASVGKAWNLPEVPQRMHENNYLFESVAAYQYDKSEALDEILMRPRRKFHLTRTYLKGFFLPSPQLPNIIIVKECAAYFPGDLVQYKNMMMQWVKKIRSANIHVMLATTVPVTPERAAKTPGQIEDIRAFNDWVREYAKKENIALLDLEAALTKDAKNRFLRDDLTIGDGLHLNRQAYDILDRLLLDTLRRNDL